MSLEAKINSCKKYLRKYLVDSTTVVLLNLFVRSGIEYAAFEGDIEKVLKARTLSTIAIYSTFWVYTSARRMIAKRLKVDSESGLRKKLLVDGTSALLYQGGFYGGILYYGVGGSPGQVGFAVAMGFGVGFILDKTRKRFGYKGDLY